MLKHILTAFSFLILSTTISTAATTKGGTVACVSEADYDEIVMMVANEDRRGFEYVINSKRCFVLRSGIQASFLDIGLSVSKVRLYNGSDGYTVWTSTSGINR